jgi:FkbM family methyltransferase
VLSYAQNFEDVMLARLFDAATPGFYVDVGAWHPTEDSVTRHFYDAGWHGINVEPIARQHRLFVTERPRDINLNVAVAATAGRRTFHDFSPAGGLSTFEAEIAAKNRALGHHCREYEVEVTTLEEIYARHDVRQIDFLKVDVEGAEREVLRGANWSAVRPRAVLVEATEPMGTTPTHGAWESILLTHGYLFAYFDGLNRYYLRREDAHLLPRLRVPPNFFDHFELARVHRLELELRHWRRTTVRGVVAGGWRRLARAVRRRPG